MPVLASDIEEHREILEDPRAGVPLGLLYRTGDAGELAGKIPGILELGRDRAARPVRGDHVAACYDWDRLARDTEQVYEGPAHSAREGLPRPEGRA